MPSLANDASWQGVWVAQGLACPTAEQVQALESGVLQQGPHWQFFDGIYCEALHGKALEGTPAIDVTGLCRSFGKLESRTWQFERTGKRKARASGIEANAFALTKCGA